MGSRVLVGPSGRPNAQRISRIVAQLAALHKRETEVVLVSSGAIAAGMAALKLQRRPDNVPDLQMAASVGQPKLMARYSELFARHRLQISQVLLTHQDLTNRNRHLNARNTLLRSLQRKIVPVVNENDTVAVDELQVGDNDLLAAMVAVLIEADALVLLSTTDGLRRRDAGPSRRIAFIESVNDEVRQHVSPKHDALSRGGMATKLEAAATAAKAGVISVIADGRRQNVLESIFDGNNVGTLVGVAQRSPSDVQRARKRWIAFFHRADGTISVDAGAAKALIRQRRSLLPVGVSEINGSFMRGALVNIESPEGDLIARGLVSYSARDLELIVGKNSAAVRKIFGPQAFEEVVHRDNLVVLDEREI